MTRDLLKAGMPTSRTGTIAAALVALIGVTICQPAHSETPTPRLGGARYGQALGAALMCYKLETTDEVSKLKSLYSGPDLEAFMSEAEKTLAAWRDVQTCEKAGGPNSCKLTQVWSCQEALREIGPAGTALAGLIRIKP
jgi:hypothetical protein